jgi:hypothetical protein
MGLESQVLYLFYDVIDLFLGRIWFHDDDHDGPFWNQALNMMLSKKSSFPLVGNRS